MPEERTNYAARVSEDQWYDTAYDSERFTMRRISPRSALLLWLGIAVGAWWALGKALVAIT